MKTSTLLLSFACSSICLLISPPIAAATRYVDGEVASSGDGTSWETAVKTIQEGIDMAVDGDTVIVATGTYLENIHFLSKNIMLRSTDPLDPSVVDNTIIDGSQRGSVVTFSGTENESCALSGLTIRNGYAPQGGGICGGTADQPTRATITHNVITGNSTAESDEGPYGGGLAFCDGSIENNSIRENTALAWGGALYDCDELIENNAIVENSALYGGGLAACSGTVQNNRISANSASAGGGLLLCAGTVRSNFIYGNDGGDLGGGLYRCNGTVQNNVIAGNASIWGAGLALCEGIIQNNTIVANSAIWYGGGLGECQGTIENCIVWGNKPSDTGGQIHQSSVPSYCCIENWTGGGERNISEAPQFTDPDGQDDDPQTYKDNCYSLSATSPCVDAGNNEALELAERDMLGNPRIMHGGRKKTPVVDIGAIEYYVNQIHADSSGRLVVTWSSLTGKTYAVYFSDDMMAWELADGEVVSADGATTSWIDDGSKTSIPPSLAHRRFYRILLNE